MPATRWTVARRDPWPRSLTTTASRCRKRGAATALRGQSTTRIKNGSAPATGSSRTCPSTRARDIYSTQTDYQAIVREAPGLIKRLADFAKIDWVPLPDEVSFTREPGSDKTDQTKNIRAMDRYDMSKFNLQSACYFDGIRAGAAADAALVIATADVVYADGTFPAIVELLESGARGICFAPFDMVHEPAAHRIAEKFAP